jgi:hypothetical protein
MNGTEGMDLKLVMQIKSLKVHLQIRLVCMQVELWKFNPLSHPKSHPVPNRKEQWKGRCISVDPVWLQSPWYRADERETRIRRNIALNHCYGFQSLTAALQS